jgi:hypothetical protein
MIARILNRKTGLLENPEDVVKKMHDQLYVVLSNYSLRMDSVEDAETMANLAKMVKIADEITSFLLEFAREETKVTKLPEIAPAIGEYWN